ncbi:Zinc finger CCCH domain-containing protein 15-like protein [Frankliniella fusca]|uniref:Zinc finger CCCH domain-containing protein 15 n=1 Tax=Frankliniella fusca TaxID=407009 RepID=A0AAE1H5Z5_9NEOP|nr:Zinc finger CCCH domain-containing protein 15-like protein [Frankliniella fusca]
MPPKAKPAAPSKKADAKKKEKVIEDKTFGLKNKKGAKQQRFIQQVEKQVKTGGVPARKLGEADKTKDKDAKAKEAAEMNMLFRPCHNPESGERFESQNFPKAKLNTFLYHYFFFHLPSFPSFSGADPKSVVCAFYKQGQCTKGNKCKFSHDLAMERKAEKRSLYVDMRDGDEEDDNMENWDEQKLAEVVEKKHGEAEKKKPTTDIICKYFLDAVEKSKYGWFWSCPNGPTCIYRHALPPGFVLKKDKKKEKKEEISLEDLIERERAALGSKLTKVTLETFIAWKKRKLKEKAENAAKEEEKKRQDFKAGRQVGISGREMFSFNPELAAGDSMDDGDEAFDSYKREDDDDEGNVEYRELNLDLLAAEAQEVDSSGTQATEDRLQRLKEETDRDIPDETLGKAEADEVAGAAAAINENLFLEDDLDGLDDELDDLELSDQDQ